MTTTTTTTNEKADTMQRTGDTTPAPRVTVLYFASLRESAGCERETLAHAGDLAALYDALRARHGFALPRERLRVALDGAFARWSDSPGEGAEVAFIPPVSGG